MLILGVDASEDKSPGYYRTGRLFIVTEIVGQLGSLNELSFRRALLSRQESAASAHDRLLQVFLDDAEIAGCVSKAFLRTPDSLANRSKWLAAFQKASIIC